MMEWDEAKAQSLKAQGLGWREIGEVFGVSYYKARANLDQAWLEKRRQQINANREPVRSVGKRDHVRHVKYEPAKPADFDAGPFTSACGIRAFYERERRILQWGLSHRVVATRVSLPFVSIQHRATLDKGRGEP